MDLKDLFSELSEVKQEIFRNKVRNFKIAEHVSPFKGSGYEVHRINQWRLGEPMTNIDWNLSLRTWPKKVYKVDRIEPKNAPVVIVADISPSIFVELDPATSRFRLLLHLIGALGFAANYFHDPVGVLAFSGEIEFYLRPKLGSGQILYACQLLLEKAVEFEDKKKKNRLTAKRSNLNLATELLLAGLRQQCSIVIVSDFADVISGESDIDPKIIEALSSKHSRNVIALFLDDPKEFSWSKAGGVVNIKNVETGKFEKVKASRASAIRETFVLGRENLRKKLEDAGADSLVLSFGGHFNQLSQFLSERRSGR